MLRTLESPMRADDYEPDIDLLRYGRFLARNWVVVCLCGLAGALVGAAATSLVPVKYVATATVAISPPAGVPLVQITPAAVRAWLARGTALSEALTETGLDRDGWTPARFVDDALDVNRVPSTNVIKVQVTLPDPSKARGAATSLASKMAEVSRRIDIDAAEKAAQAIAAQMSAAERSVAAAEKALIDYQMSAEIERLEGEIRTAAEHVSPRSAVGTASQALQDRRAELYRRKLELHRREVDYDVRLRAFTDVKERAAQAGTSPADTSQLHLVEPASGAPARRPRPLATFTVLGLLGGIAGGFGAALVRQKRRMAVPATV